MKLIKLSSSVPSFHTVQFNHLGLSIVSARRRTASNDVTYNSVGKSLMIYLLHFCLGAKKNTELEEKLPGWSFRLDFELDGTLHYCFRETEKQDYITLDGLEYKLKAFNKKMGEMIFGLDDDSIQGLSYRSMISRFIRGGKYGYTSFDKFVKKEQDEIALLNTGYLLGLAPARIRKKIEQRLESEFLRNQDQNLKKDPVISSIFLSGGTPGDIDIKIVELEQQINKLSTDISNFVVAEDYNEIKLEADEISRQLFDLRNSVTKYHIALDNINKSMQRRPDISKENLVQFFNEANVSLGSAIIKKLEDVEQFNARILDDRTRILVEQKNRYEQMLEKAEVQIATLSSRENEKLQYLNAHGALDDYTKLTELLSDCKLKLDRLSQYKQMVMQYKQKREELKRSIADENLETQRYIDSITLLIRQHLTVFHDCVKRFYKDKIAGLKIENNEGDNKLRFTIDARISDDTGDGVNETKLFCFDWTLLQAQCNHSVKFLVHDNRILSETDPRQVATMLRLANDICKERGFQYILTINESTIDALRKEMNEEEFKALVINQQVLQLDDTSEQAKLLGIQVDLKYE